MGLIGNGKGFVVGFVAGFGTGMITKEVFPHLELTQLLKGAMRTGITLAERSKELASRASEIVQDNWAEVQLELKKRQASGTDEDSKSSEDSSSDSDQEHLSTHKKKSGVIHIKRSAEGERSTL